MNLHRLAIRNLAGQPIRSILTTIGVAVAIAGCVALTGLTQGAQQSFASGLWGIIDGGGFLPRLPAITGSPDVDVAVFVRDGADNDGLV